MSNNVTVGPNAIVAKDTVTFADAGLNGTNTEIIYKVGPTLQSFVPGRAINGISGFESQKGYYLVAKTAMDLSAHVIPPIDGLNITPDAPTSGVVDDTANTFNWTNNPLYTALSDYEFTVDAGSTVSNVTAKPLIIGDVNRAIGAVGVRVKAATGRNVSAWLFNTVAFTSAGGGFDTDAQAWFTATEGDGGTFTSPEKTAYNAFVVGMKSDGLWSKLDVMATNRGTAFAHTKRDLKTPTNIFTLTGSATFSGGYLNGGTFGSTEGLYLGKNPSNYSHLYTAFVDVLDNSNAGTAGIPCDIGCMGTSAVTLFSSRSAANNAEIRMSEVPTGQTISGVTNAIGVYCIACRSTGYEAFKNGTSMAAEHTRTINTTSVSDFVLGNAYDGQVSSSRRIGFAGIFNVPLTNTEITNFQSRISTLKTAISR